jgi:dolichyl-diphosphooligosaccharide--protein glycosyltransferase
VATFAVVGVCIAVALAVRIVWPYPNVVVDGHVWFREFDGWYHMRLVDNLVAHFPHTTAFDPYTFYPHGVEPPFHPLTGWLIAALAMLVGGLSPSAHAVDMAGALYPAILGSLTIVPAYVIARRLGGPVAGAISALVLATMPGEFLSRSLFGFTDHHVTEAFFSTLTLLFLLLATRAAATEGVTLAGLRKSGLGSARQTLLYTALSGISLGLYLVGWRGGLLLLAILLVYTIVRSVHGYLRGARTDDVVIVVSISTAIGGLMVSPLIPSHWMPSLYVAALVATIGAPIALNVLGVWARRRHWSPKTTILSLSGLVALCVAAIALVSPTVLQYARGAIDFLVPTGAGMTITEMHPLFLPGGHLSVRVAWTSFVTVLPASILALVLLWRMRSAPRGTELALFVVWSLCMLVAVLLQRRFGYYYSVDAAVLTGLLAAWVWRSTYVQTRIQSLSHDVQTAASTSKAARKAARAQHSQRRDAVWLIAMLVAAFVVTIGAPCLDMARNYAVERALMTPGWYETLEWLRDNTPQPLEPDGYYRMYDRPAAGQDFDYPEQAWSIMTWWDYGHWITRVSHRIPVANPFQEGARTAARYFLTKSESEGVELVESLDSRYVVTDARTSILTFNAVVAWNGEERSDYYESYSQRTSGSGLESIVLYYPAYFQSTLVRLQCLSGQAVHPESFRVIRYEETGGLPGAEKLIVGLERFPTYEDALAFIQSDGDDHLRIVSTDPCVSCVPLEALERYTLVFESEEKTTLAGHDMSAVRVFQVAGA